MKPLFIPLKGEYYDAFASGKKKREYRRYGPRWNERTCRVGRPVTLSRGYGKQHRMTGVVSGFLKEDSRTFRGPLKDTITRLFGSESVEIATIAIDLDLPPR